MTKPRISQVLLWTLAVVTLALFGFFVALVAGALPVGDPPAPPDTGALPLSQTEPADQPATTAVTKRVRRTTPAPATTATSTTTAATTTKATHDDGSVARNRDRHGLPRGLLDLGPPRLGERARARGAATRSGRVGDAAGRARLDVDRRSGERRRDGERRGSRNPVRHRRCRSRPGLGQSDRTFAGAAVETKARPRGRCGDPSCRSPIRVLDHAREPHEGLCKT